MANKTDKLTADVLNFVLWLTPCGECSNPPTYELIGQTARDLNKRILEHIDQNNVKTVATPKRFHENKSETNPDAESW